MIRVIVVMRQEQNLIRIREVIDSREDVTVIGTGTDSYAAIRLVETGHPDIAIIDYQLDYNAPDIVSLIKRRVPDTSIILISSHNDEKNALDALSRGVSAYLPWKPDMDVLISVIYVVQAGGHCISRRIMSQVFRVLPKPFRSGEITHKFFSPETAAWQYLNFSSLNRTELRIFEFIGQGKSTKEISEILHLKIGTVRNYISSLMRKSGVKNRMEMIYFVLGHRQYQSRLDRTPQRNSRSVSAAGRPEKFLPLLEASLNVEG